MCFLDRPDPRRQVAIAQQCERLGYESIWVCETRTARDAISVLGAMAYATERIKLSSGVVNSWTRPASLMALTFASLSELAPGRMVLGIGAYWDPLAWKQGINREKPLKQMREYVEVFKRLLRFETVSFEGELVQVRDLRLELGHGVELEPDLVPVYIGATGFKMLELSGAIANGVLLNAFTSLVYQDKALRHIETGAQQAGRSIDDLDLPQLVVVCMDNDDPDRARTTAHYVATMYLGQQPHIAKASGIPQELLDDVNRTMGGWPPKEGGIQEAMELVPRDVVDSLAASGTAEECRKQVEAYITRPNIYPVVLPLTDNYEEIADGFGPSLPLH
ncbi:MAG: LLM class flavin-dependent oxidoreductase [Actinomycetota bacterium]